MAGPFTGSVDRAALVARIKTYPLGDQPAQQRRQFARLVLGEEDGASAATDLIFDGAGGTIVHFHGGGYAFGSPRTHARLGAQLARLTGCRVILPAYPLAPEYQWPAQMNAALATVREIAQERSTPILLSGDSAGGHLALVTALEAARLNFRVAGLLLFSPNTDRSGMSRTRICNDPLDPMVDNAGDRQLARQCFGDMPANHLQVSPLLDDLSLLPPLYVEVGAEEVLLDDSLLLAQRAWDAGVSVTLHVQPDGLHMGQLWTPWFPAAVASLHRAAVFIRIVIEQHQHS